MPIGGEGGGAVPKGAAGGGGATPVPMGATPGGGKPPVPIGAGIIITVTVTVVLLC